MSLSLKLIYALIISVILAIIHTIAEVLQAPDGVMGIISIGGMAVAQIAAFGLLKRKSTALTFGNIFGMLCITQVMVILLLSLNSAYDPLVTNKPLNFAEIAMSLVIFSIIMPLIVSGIVFFAAKKKAQA